MASEGLDYIELGRITGVMAAKVLKGEAKASEMPYEIITEASLYVNTPAMQALNMTLPEDLAAEAIEVSEE